MPPVSRCGEQQGYVDKVLAGAMVGCMLVAAVVLVENMCCYSLAEMVLLAVAPVTVAECMVEPLVPIHTAASD